MMNMGLDRAKTKCSLLYEGLLIVAMHPAAVQEHSSHAQLEMLIFGGGYFCHLLNQFLFHARRSVII